jgi:hypothetical protein
MGARPSAPVAPEPLRHATLSDFAIERVIGIGGFGRVSSSAAGGGGGA